MELKKTNWIGFETAFVLIVISLILRNTKFFFLIFGIGIVAAVLPFVLAVMKSNKDNQEKEDMFLEFSRDLVESVKTGTPISKTIINIKDKPYGALSKYIQKLGNQISLGIPLGTALQIFADEVNNKTVSRSIILIGQAERAGGDIGQILESVAGAVSLSDKLKKERQAAVQTLATQGYIIFFVFIVIILLMQFKIVPMVSGMSGSDSSSSGMGGLGISFGSGSGGVSINPNEISNAFLYLLLIQGFFSGLTIGKLTEGDVKAGIRHSFALMLMSFLIATGANVIFG